MRRNALTKLFLCVFVLCFAAISIGATKFSKVYDNATQLMVDGDYAGAAELFDSIASYEDSATLSMYCKAILLAEQGEYDEAISAFEFFGDYKDCKYLVVYYSGCQIEDLASSDPLRYLDAAAKFKSISLFRDSSARAESCCKELYDVAAELLEQGDYETAFGYFNALGDYSDSAIRLQECIYRYGMELIKEKRFTDAADVFKNAGDYEDAEEKMQLAQKLAALKVSPEYMLVDENYDIIYEYDDDGFYLGDVSELLFDYYGMEIHNQGKEKLKYTVTCEMDGENYSWKENELDAGKTTWYPFTEPKAPENFQEGVHTCVWYIDGVEVLSDTYTVKNGISEKREEASALADSIEVETAVAQYEKETDKLSGIVTGTTISASELWEGKEYVPTVIIRNTTDSMISLNPIAVIDGKLISWKTTEIEPSRTMRLYSSEPLGKGSHRIQVLIDGIDLADWEFEIVDDLEASPELSEGVLPKIGYTVRFGKYEQDNNLTNGQEDIEWIVLDVQKDRALLISKFALDCVPYNEETVDTTWETCSLRAWLNDDFLKEAFSDTERKKILLTKVDNSEDQGNLESKVTGGNVTEDKIFLLSWREADKYFASGASRICRATPYAAARERCTVDDTGTCFWWLRSPGNSQNSAAFIDSMGGLGSGGSVGYREHTDRPAMWVKLPHKQEGTLYSGKYDDNTLVKYKDKDIESKSYSGSFYSDTGTPLNVNVEWNAIKSGTNTVDVFFTIFAESLDLYTTEQQDKLRIKLDSEEVRLPVPAIEIKNTEKLVKTQLNTWKLSINMSENEVRGIPVKVNWDYNGTYDGLFLDTIECSDTIYIRG